MVSEQLDALFSVSFVSVRLCDCPSDVVLEYATAVGGSSAGSASCLEGLEASSGAVHMIVKGLPVPFMSENYVHMSASVWEELPSP